MSKLLPIYLISICFTLFLPSCGSGSLPSDEVILELVESYTQDKYSRECDSMRFQYPDTKVVSKITGDSGNYLVQIDTSIRCRNLTMTRTREARVEFKFVKDDAGSWVVTSDREVR